MIRAFLVVLLLCLAGCDRQDEPRQGAAKPALWAIEDREGDPLGWLFGTIHALPDGTQWEGPALTRAIDDARLLVVEVSDLDPKRVAAILTRLATDEPGPPLAERLSDPARRKLTDLLLKERVPRNRFDNLETWAAALAVSRLGASTAVGNGVDHSIIARFAGRPVAELEGAAAQLAIFDRLPERDQRSLMAAVLAERDEADEAALAEAWLRGDLAELERTTRRGLLADPALYEALAAGRNAAWLGRIIPMIESGQRPLVAVGTAHMLGPDGLPALLAASGYRVQRIQ